MTSELQERLRERERLWIRFQLDGGFIADNGRIIVKQGELRFGKRRLVMYGPKLTEIERAMMAGAAKARRSREAWAFIWPAIGAACISLFCIAAMIAGLVL